MAMQTTRRRRTSVPATEIGPVVARLRLRSGLSQSALAAKAGIGSSSTVSRLERGKTEFASWDLVNRLANALDDNGELWSAAGAIPGDVLAEIAWMWRAYAPGFLFDRTIPAIRRTHYANIAAEFLDNAQGALGGGNRVPAKRLAAALKTPHQLREEVAPSASVTITPGTIVVRRPKPRASTDGGDPQDNTERDAALSRFLTVHGVAHVLLELPDCEWPKITVTEAKVDDLATQLLVPPAILSNAFEYSLRSAQGGPQADGWAPETAQLIELIARRVGAPVWVVVRRLGEDDLLQDHSSQGPQ